MLSQAQISYILTLIEIKNFQRAADACFVTQPTLSMQIKKAERSLGGTIFNRDSQPLSLTEFGRNILPYLERIDTEYQQLKEAVQRLEGSYKAEIRIGIIPTISGYLVPELYKKWQEELGDIQLDIIELKTTDLISAVENKKIDLGIMAGPLNDKLIQQQILYNEEILIYSPGIESKQVSQQQLEELRPWLLSEGNCLRTQMINFCNLNNQSKDDWQYEGGSLNILLEMVDLEGGYTLVPSNYISHLGKETTAFKKIDGVTPIRQIIGIHFSRNSKKEHINRLMRLIQSNKMQESLQQVETEILPWA
jgi:LysR family hydrogen peroxide-inducible transcriptional activator